MHEVVGRMAAAAGIPEATADEALRVILNFLATDGPGETVEKLVADLGAGDYLGQKPSGGGLLGALGGLFGGGGAMAAFSALTGAGLDMDQIQTVVKTFIDYAREKVGEETVNQVIAAIPGLEKLL